jgi:hypothetical protein
MRPTRRKDFHEFCHTFLDALETMIAGGHAQCRIDTLASAKSFAQEK